MCVGGVLGDDVELESRLVVLWEEREGNERGGSWKENKDGCTIAHVMTVSSSKVKSSSIRCSILSLIHANIPSGESARAYEIVWGFVPCISM